MPNPFPGMNPYFENPAFWSEVHHLLISILAETLNPQLLPHYRAAIEKRVYQMSGEDILFIGIPDVTVQRFRPATNSPSSSVAIAPPASPVSVTVPMPMEFREGYLEVRDTMTQVVVTVVELLSPTNKRPGEGRHQYQEKRQAVLGSNTHLVEIDLLRGGTPMPVMGSDIRSDYRILVSRSQHRPRADLYCFNLSEQIPLFPLPLRSPDTEPVIDLHSLLNQVYERAGYEVAIDYRRDPVIPLDEAACWMNALLQDKGLR
ncbi:MAG: DUF4058 family protein [Chroococcidiopsidaceae cyanobacterium CP_BM_RX_35]|nr:DUF4058 family protein [Chroococcidiopsidaceae cyanobacterium CP_BM_RX_35]